MAYGISLLPAPFKSGADLSTKQYSCVKLNSTGVVVLPSAGEAIVGVLQNDPISGADATVETKGITKVRAGGTFDPGVEVVVGSDGKVIAYAAPLDVPNGIKIGYSLAAGADTQITTIKLY
jgi:hypothetical protein